MADQKRNNTPALSFLSCSIHKNDQPVVNCFVKSVLIPSGFKCYTVGKNYSEAGEPNKAIKNLIGMTHCLVGIATKRYEAKSIFDSENTLSLATTFLTQETSMAYQAGLPYLIFKSKGVELPGLTGKNLYIEFEYNRLTDRIKFSGSKSNLDSALCDLKLKAEAYKSKNGQEKFKKYVGMGSAVTLLGMGTVKFIDWINQPSCFGDFYYKDTECKNCSVKEKCKIQKMKNAE